MIVTRGSKFIHDMIPNIRGWARKLVQNDGIIRSLDPIGMRPLPHRMSRFRQKERYGYFLRLRTDCSPSDLKEFENLIRNDFDVLRFMTRQITYRDILREHMYYYPDTVFKDVNAEPKEDPIHREVREQIKLEQKETISE